MAWIVALLARWGLSQAKAQRWAPFVAAGLALAALWAAFQLWDWLDDNAAVEADRNASNAAFRERQVKAERQAGAAKTGRDRAEAARQGELEDRVNEANSIGGSAADDVWSDGLWAEPED